MPPRRTYTTAGAFRRALEERLKGTSQTDQIDINRLRRHVSFDRLLARLFHAQTVPWALKGGYALELRFKAARSTVDIDLTLQQVPATAASESLTGIVREMLQSAADVPLGDWFEYTLARPSWIWMRRLTVAPVIRSRLGWTQGYLLVSIWTPALETLSCSRWKLWSAGTGSALQGSRDVRS